MSGSNKISFFIAGNGFGFGGKAKVQNGVHESLRLLSEASSVELLGKLKLLPYWNVIPNATPEHQVINNFKRKFRALPNDEQLIYIFSLLSKYYMQINENNFDYYVVKFKKDYGLYPTDNKITPELFARLLINLPKSELKKEALSKRKELLNSVIK